MGRVRSRVGEWGTHSWRGFSPLSEAILREDVWMEKDRKTGSGYKGVDDGVCNGVYTMAVARGISKER